MKQGQALVSVIAVCYNQSPYVLECLESIRTQTYPNIQLIIMDDCSRDDSVAVMQKWIESTGVAATFIAHAQNQGICRTFNEGLAHATGEYIAFVAADDVYLPEKISEQVRLLEQLPDTVGVVYSDSWQIDEAGNLLPLKFIEAHREFERPPEGDIFPLLLEKNFIPAMTTLIRQKCYQAVGHYDENLCYEDYDLWLRISQRFHFAYSPVISTKYRIVRRSASRTVLHLPSWPTLRSNFIIYEKCLSSSKLDHSLRRLILDQLNTFAEQMYAGRHRGRSRYLLKLAWYDPRPYSVAMCICSLAGLSITHFAGLVNRFGSVRQGLKALR